MMHIFEYKLDDKILRKMNRQQYKETQHWLRLVARRMSEKLAMREIAGVDATLAGKINLAAVAKSAGL